MKRQLPIQIIITSLLLIFVFNNFGYWFCFKMEQAGIKQEMFEKTKQALPNAELISLTIPLAESNTISWQDNNEFTYKGEMYDVVRTEKTVDNTIVYYCLSDAKEEALYTNLNTHIKGNLYGDKSNGKHSNDLLKLFSQTYFNNVQEFYFFEQANNTVPLLTSITYTSIKLDILCPPPDRIS